MTKCLFLFKKHLNSPRKKALFAIFLIAITALLFPFSKPFFDADYSLMVVDENGEVLRIFLNKNEQWCLPPVDTIETPEKLEKAVLHFEDQYFRFHPGVNPVSVLRAAYQNISEKRIVSGASTITMQLARIRKPKKRTFLNKILEMMLAIKIEVHFSKDEILKMYLDHAPYGGNIIGYRAASHRYFYKEPEQLSWAEAATLAVLPNAPGLVAPQSDNQHLKTKRDRLLAKLVQNEVIDSSTFELAVLESVPDFVFKFDILSPHLTRQIYSTHKNRGIVKTTLNKDIQMYVEMLAKQHITNLKRQGIKNCAALVVETQTGKVKAYVGSQDFFDFQSQGQVDGVRAARSSGSILKPFLYALSMDAGIVIPQTQMIDVPSYFSSFSPNNADKKFSGVVTAKEALVSSLNVPAVRLLNTYGVYSFYSFMKSAGVSTLFRTADEYGLPLIIGGAEVTMWDMTRLFRGLAQGGAFSESYYLAEDSAKARKTSPQFISPGACYLTLDVLKELKRPGAEYYWQQYQNQRPIAWKTGTSYGHKDAWAVGVSPNWTIAVWTGNFSGEGNPNLSGARSAGPLLFGIFNYLPQNENSKWFEKTEMDFTTVNICKETGFLAGSSCNDTVKVDVPINMQPLRLCPFHKNIFVDKDEQKAVCSHCWEKGYHNKHYLVYPPDVVYHLRKRGQFVEEIPNHNPDCDVISGFNPLSFVYPRDSATIWIPKDFDGKFQKLVSKIVHKNRSTTVFWYLDDAYLSSTREKHNMGLELNSGWHNLLVTDENGFSDKVRFQVKVSK